MSVRAYIAIAVLVCSIGGLALALGLSRAYAAVNRDIEAYGASSALARDFDRLDENLSQWAVTSDLVYGSGDTYLIEGALRRGVSIQATIARIVDDPMAAAYVTTIIAVRRMVESNTQRLNQAIGLDESEREHRLSMLLTSWDTESADVFLRLSGDQQSLEQAIAENRAAAGEHRDRLGFVSLFSVIGYVILVGLIWWWTTVTIGRPLVRLARDAEAALQRNQPFSTPGNGPLEARALAISLQAFAGNLEHIVRERSKDVHGLIELRDAMFDAVPIPVLHRDVAGRFMECNRAFETFFGVVQTDLVGLDTAALPDTIKSLLTHTHDSGIPLETRECTVRNADGADRVVLFTEAVVGDADDESGIVSVLVDITFRFETDSRAIGLGELRTIEAETVAAILERVPFREVIDLAIKGIGQSLGASGTTLVLRPHDIILQAMEGRRQWRRDLASPDRIDLFEPLAETTTPWQDLLNRGDPVIASAQTLKNSRIGPIRALYESGIRSLLILPVRIEENFVGTITVDDVVDRQWHEDELLALMSFVQGGCRAVERVRALQRSIEYARELQGMLRELDHRVKNNLATILSMADQMAKQTDTVETFQEAFAGRINSMARAHELLAASKWSGVDLRQAFEIVLAANHGGGRATLDGPSVMLPAEIATPVCLVLNELATNAAKYGSLSVDAGRLEVRWTLQGDRLELVWHELDGPKITLPFGTGLGTRLIDGFIDYQLGGRTQRDATSGGLRIRISLPLARSTVDRISIRAEADS